MALITRETRASYNYCIPIESLLSFFNGRVSVIAKDSKESKIGEIPDTVVFRILSFLEKPADFSSFSGTNRAFFFISGQMPADHAASDSMLFFLCGRHLFRDRGYKRHAEGLVRTVALRPLTSEEWLFALTCFTDNRAVKLANSAELSFFAAFKRQCTALGAMHDTARLAVYRECAFNGLEGIAKSDVSCLQRAVFPFKLESVRNRFDRRLYLEMIVAYVKKGAKAVSEESFLSATKKFSDLFPEIAVVDVERDLRNALRKRHSGAFGELAEYYSHPKIEEIEEEAKDQLTKVEGFGETLKDSESKKQGALEELARIFKEKRGYLNQNELMHQSMSEDASVTEARSEYYAALDNYSHDKKKYDALEEDLNALLQRKGDLKEKAEKKSSFYRELQKEVTENNKLALSHALRTLLDK